MIYEYECRNCKHNFDIKQSIHDDSLKECPKCKGELFRVINVPHVHIYGEPTTIGHLAESNTKKLGKYELQSKEKQQKEAKKQAKIELMKQKGSLPQDATELPDKKTWYNPEGKDLDKLSNMNDKQTEKYIMEGN